jgi:hypothetical protein
MKIVILSTLVVLSLSVLARAQPITLGFDDIITATGPGSITTLPVLYNGLNSYNFYVAASDAFPGSTFSSGVVSGNYAAFDGYGGTAAQLSSSTPFTLLSADLTSVWDATDTVEVQGYLAGNPVFDTTVNLTSAAPVSPTDFTPIDATPIDTLDFTITGDPDNDNFAVDNLSVSYVPEPASLGLLSLGGLRLLRRRPRR